MHEESFRTTIDSETADAIVTAARTSLGDTLRSVVYFTPSKFDVLYVRQDIYTAEEDIREAKSMLVDFEEVGFAEAHVRTAIAKSKRGSTIGEYEFTVRFHEDGFVIRLIEGDGGVILTTDGMDVDAFEDAVTAVKGLLREE